MKIARPPAFLLAALLALATATPLSADDGASPGSPDTAPNATAETDGRSLATSPTISGCRVFPADSIWNTPIDHLPVHPRSDDYVASIGADKPAWPDFGAGLYEGGPIGMPFVVVPMKQPKVRIRFTPVGGETPIAGESDKGPYPIPADAPIEGGRESTGDRHVIVVQEESCTLYELYKAAPRSDGSWSAIAAARFDLEGHELRVDGWTSADASGLPIFPGLVRYDEVADGEIRHALRFTAPRTRSAYVWPARHFASDDDDPALPAMGQRFRLRADYDLSGFSPEVQVILRALQTYGMMLADNGSPWFITGAPDDRWNNDRLAELRRLKGADFEAVDVSALQVDPDSGRARRR
ncbi:MAG: hypothetical protein R3D33_12870 [Hyphomicrobiaceae bacterium]